MTKVDKSTFEKNVNDIMDIMNVELHSTLFGMMEPRLESCDFENLTLTMSYPIHDWEKNVLGVTHGGITSSIADTTMGALSYCCCGGFTPTINLNVAFQRPGTVGGRLFCRAEVTMCGKTVVYCDCRIWNESTPEKTVATGQGVFRNLYGEK